MTVETETVVVMTGTAIGIEIEIGALMTGGEEMTLVNPAEMRGSRRRMGNEVIAIKTRRHAPGRMRHPVQRLPIARRRRPDARIQLQM